MNFHVLTMAKTDTKVKNQVLTNILHCSVDREMVLPAQELAPSGIMLVILSMCTSEKGERYIIHTPGLS